MPNSVSTFEEKVMVEIRRNSIKTLITHPSDILSRVVYAVDCVFVSKDPTEDTPEAKKAVVAGILRGLTAAVEDDSNPLNMEFVVGDDGNYTGNFKFKITPEYGELMLPDALLKRSELNRVRRAAKEIAGR